VNIKCIKYCTQNTSK